MTPYDVCQVGREEQRSRLLPPMPEYQHLVVDTDTASDDAVALMLAVGATEASLEAVTVVAGNVPVEIGERNALATLELMGHPEVPVHRGLERPLIRSLSTGQHVHGADGMGDHDLIHPRGRRVQAGATHHTRPTCCMALSKT